MRQIVLDTETTGLSPEHGHRIIEIGCLELVNRRLTGNNLHFYINPERVIERAAEEVHGITTEFLEDKPHFGDIAEELLNYLKDGELIIHNAPFDLGFLNAEFKLLKNGTKKITNYCSVLDTLALARKKHPGQRNSLDALCRRYHVDNSDRELHGALLDAKLLTQVYLLLTGGQSQLFGEEQTEKVEVEQEALVTVPQQRAKLKVIRANEQEIKEHEAFMKMLEESSSS